MTVKHLLVHLDGSDRASVRLNLAINLAKRFGARLTGLFAQSETSGPSLVARRASEHLKRAAEDVRRVFEAKTGEAGVAGVWWQLEHGEYSHVLTETVICSRYADLAILGQHNSASDAKVPGELVEEVILNAGRPVLVVPFAGDFQDTGQRVIVAWNGSRESARALGDAVPLMESAKSVLILALHAARPEDVTGVPPVNVVSHLETHGIMASLERMTVENMGLMDVVLNRASDDGADLLVMGGHGNYGFPFLARGGNTRHILRQMTVPVLMSF